MSCTVMNPQALYEAKEAARARMDEAIRRREAIKATLREVASEITVLKRGFESARGAWLAQVEGGAQ